MPGTAERTRRQHPHGEHPRTPPRHPPGSPAVPGAVGQGIGSGLFVPAAALVPLTGLVGSGGDDRVTVVAGLALLATLALAAVVATASPVSLTPAGEDVRRRARAFARTAAATRAPAELGAPAVLVRGPYLVHATATGVAPQAARDIGVGRTLAQVLATPSGRPTAAA